MVTRSDELAESSSARYPGVWIQYKGDRARVLQTVEEYGRESLRAAIINEFMGDLEALSLAVPGQSMQDVRVVWGTGQVRATYTIRDAEFCNLVKYNVLRCLRNKDELSERSIAQILYSEGGSTINLRASTSGQSKSKPSSAVSSKGHEASPSDRTPFVIPPFQTPTTTTGSHTPRNTPGIAVVPSSNRRGSTSNSVISLPASTTASSYTNSPRGSLPRAPISQGLHAPQILPPIYLGRDILSPPDQGAKSHPPAGTILRLPQQPLSAPVSASAGKRLLPALSIHKSSPLIPNTSASRTLAVFSQPTLTPGTCMRLADPSEESIWSTSPVVKFLVIRDVLSFREGEKTHAHEAYVTDGDGYAWIALASVLNERICIEDDRRSLQVGSTARISGISRLQPPDTCIALVREFELLESSNILPSASDQTPADLRTTSPAKPPIDISGPVHSDLQQERAARLLAEMKLREERKRRVVLERALADVCRDLHHKNAQDTLVPAALEALMAINELADAAMVVDRSHVGGE